MSTQSPDIVIIGGGVTGTSIAFHLSRKGVPVTLVEAGDLASGSSGSCDGLVFMQSKKPGIHLLLAMESLKRFSTLQAELPVDIEFRQTGGRVIIQRDEEYPAMEKFVRAQREIGLDVSLMDRESTLSAEPFLSPEIYGSTYSPLDGQVNPISLTLAFALAAKQNHAKILTNARVIDIKTRNNRITGVYTTKGELKADIVINAAGSMGGLISKMVGLSMPITPRRGQIVVTQATSGVISSCMISAQYIAAKFDPALANKAGEGISIEQAVNGNLLLGSTREFEGFCKENTISGIRKIVRQTASIIPSLKELQIIRTFAGLRPYTPDGLPILGPVRSLEGFFMAAGHEGDGIALSPITGELMADMVSGVKPRIDLDPFSPKRFETKGGGADA